MENRSSEGNVIRKRRTLLGFPSKKILEFSSPKSLIAKASAPESWAYFGAFSFLYFSFLVSFALPLFNALQCVYVSATGKYHMFSGLDTVRKTY